MLWGLWRDEGMGDLLGTVEASTREEALRELSSRFPDSVGEHPVVEPVPVQGRSQVGWFFSGPTSEPLEGDQL